MYELKRLIKDWQETEEKELAEIIIEDLVEFKEGQLIHPLMVIFKVTVTVEKM